MGLCLEDFAKMGGLQMTITKTYRKTILGESQRHIL